MKMQFARDTGLTVQMFDSQRCQFGLTELAAPLLAGGADLLGDLGGLLGFGAADAAGAGAIGAGALGAGDAAATAGATTLADIVGTGTGLAGGATGLEGTLLAGGASGGLEGALGAGAATAGGTALDFLANPAASGFNPAALTDAGGAEFGSIGSLTGATPTSAGGTTAVGSPSSVFNTGTSPVTGINSVGQPAAVGSSAVSAPTGVGAVPDATSVAGGTVPGATGATSLGGAPLTAAPSTNPIEALLGKAGASLTNNPLATALGIGGLGYNIYAGQKNTANEKALTADAQAATANSNTLTASGQALEQYLTNGTLPPAYQAQVDQAISSAKATAISNAAAQGLPTDPNRNTALAATLAQIDESRSTIQTQVATQLFQSGSGLVSQAQNAASLSGQLYQALVSNDTQQAASIGKSIATLASALNGKTSGSIGGTNITIG